jgi:hypothetical protein
MPSRIESVQQLYEMGQSGALIGLRELIGQYRIFPSRVLLTARIR